MKLMRFFKGDDPQVDGLSFEIHLTGQDPYDFVVVENGFFGLGFLCHERVFKRMD